MAGSRSDFAPSWPPGSLPSCKVYEGLAALSRFHVQRCRSRRFKGRWRSHPAIAGGQKCTNVLISEACLVAGKSPPVARGRRGHGGTRLRTIISRLENPAEVAKTGLKTDLPDFWQSCQKSGKSPWGDPAGRRVHPTRGWAQIVRAPPHSRATREILASDRFWRFRSWSGRLVANISDLGLAGCGSRISRAVALMVSG